MHKRSSLQKPRVSRPLTHKTQSRAVIQRPKRQFSTDSSATRSHFQDRCRIQVRGGDGGDGCASYERTYHGIGGPDGGNGGRGGDVYLYTDPNISTFDFSRFHFKAGKGGSGGAECTTGRIGDDLILNIPAGTIIREIIGRDRETGQIATKLITDMNEPGQRLKIAQGAAGGFGNRTFRAQDRPKAQFTTHGALATPRRYELELKLIADVALVGFPNAGKSSFLRACSNTDPKIANYPFTTLCPEIGSVSLPDTEFAPFTVADLPGLVDGAHMNVGLGHEFLRHIERTKVLCYVIDIARPIKYMKTVQELKEKHDLEMMEKRREIETRQHEEDARLEKIISLRREKMARMLKSRGVPEDEYGNYQYHQLFPDDKELEGLLTHKGTRRIYDKAWDDRPRNIHVTDLGDPVAEFLALRKELALYQPELAARPAIVLANKIDKNPNACQTQLQRLREVVPKHWPLFSGSAKENMNIQPILHTMAHMLTFINVEKEHAMALAQQQNDDNDIQQM